MTEKKSIEKTSEQVWNKCRYDYETSDLTYQELADKYGLKKSTVRTRRYREKWEKRNQIGNTKVAIEHKDPKAPKPKAGAGNKPKKAHNRTDPSKEIQNDLQEMNMGNEGNMELLDINDNLSETEKMFVLHYIKYKNATKSYKLAMSNPDISDSNASLRGYHVLNRPHVKAEINRLSKILTDQHMLTASDIIGRYVDIMQADIKDFVRFGTETAERQNERTGEWEEYERNVVYFKDMDKVDGTIIQEISIGREGAKIKLYDKYKAMEALAKYTQALDSKRIRDLEERKLELQIKQMEMQLEQGIDNQHPTTLIVSNTDQMRAEIERRKRVYDTDSTE